MINKNLFKNKLSEAIEMYYPKRNCSKNLLKGKDNPVRKEIDEYVAIYYAGNLSSDDLKKLFIEKNRLYEECLDELGIR